MIFFFLKKVVTSLVLPPGILIAITVICGLYLIRKKSKIGYLLFFSAICLYLLSTVPVQDALLVPLENSFPLQTQVKGDVIVMLGGGVLQEAPDTGGRAFSLMTSRFGWWPHIGCGRNCGFR